MEVEVQFQPGERIAHQEFGQGVVLEPVHDGYLRAFFGVGERRVPIASVRRELSRTERMLRGVAGGAERSRKAWLTYEAYALPVIGSAFTGGGSLPLSASSSMSWLMPTSASLTEMVRPSSTKTFP